MAEAFSNSFTRAAGSVTTASNSTVAAASTAITVTSATGIGVSDLIDNSNFIAGTRVRQIDGTTIYADRTSTNSSTATSQTVKFLGVTTAYTSAAATKSILIGGTFANNTNSQVGLTVEIYDASGSVGVALASKIPVPAGSSFVISDVGKTLLQASDEVRIYCDVDNAIDASLSILTGVS
jgi:hypothetical protein